MGSTKTPPEAVDTNRETLTTVITDLLKQYERSNEDRRGLLLENIANALLAFTDGNIDDDSFHMMELIFTAACQDVTELYRKRGPLVDSAERLFPKVIQRIAIIAANGKPIRVNTRPYAGKDSGAITERIGELIRTQLPPPDTGGGGH